MKPKTRLEWFLAKIAGDTDATGTVTPKTRKEFYLKEIADNGGGSSLPAVTASDNGSVLAVVDGAWDKAAPDPYPGYDVVIASDGQNYTLVKGTYSDIRDRIKIGGKPVNGLFMVGYLYGDHGWWYSGSLCFELLDSQQNYIKIYGWYRSEESFATEVLYWLPDGTITPNKPT